MGNRRALTGYIDHPSLGRVTVHARLSTPRMIARWQGGRLHVSVPCESSPSAIISALDRMAPRLLASRPAAPRYLPGERIEMPGLTIEFAAQRSAAMNPRSVRAYPSLPLTIVEIGSALDMERPEDAQTVAKVLRNVAARFAPELLLPRAREIAARIGVSPARWSISRGAKVLGTCTSAREIRLSANLVFFPAELRDYVICHELAHLTEMNHSPRFHTLCNTYCNLLTSTPPSPNLATASPDRATTLRAALRTFRLPFP